MHPVTGPFTTIIGTGGPGTFHYLYRISSRQARPYNMVLPFEEQWCVFTAYNGATYGPSRYSNIGAGIVQNGFAMEDNIAYSKIIGKIHADNADAGILVGEYKSSRDMISTRSKNLLDLAKAAKARNPKKFFEVARSAVNPNKKDVRAFNSKSMSNLWLEYSWGWRPMIEDIFKSLETITKSDFSERYLRAGHNKSGRIILHQQSDTWVYAGVSYTQVYNEYFDYSYRCSTGAKVSISNPNLALANRLGLINPIGVIWAVQPFSFIVDKYVNIGQMINSVTDLAGFQLEQAWTSRRLSGACSEYYRVTGSNGYYEEHTMTGVHQAKKRGPGLLGPVPALRVPSIGSLSEAASYIALVTQLLTK